MDWLLPSRNKSPPELVKSTQNNIKQLEDKKIDPKTAKKCLEKISANLNAMKFMLYGDGDQEPKADIIKKLTDEIFKTDVLLELIQNLHSFEFEARKDVAQIYNFVLRQRKELAVEYVRNHSDILRILVNGYSDPTPGVALNCGSILREVIRHKELNELILASPLFEKFFQYVQLSTFDVASDAFFSFKLMLTKHKTQCAKFLDAHYEQVFTNFNILLESKNYVTKRQSLKLLGELLLNRSNFNVMMRYINDPNNLKIVMNLLRANTKDIQLEAFHVFKIFVANPKKSRSVLDILLRNRGKLIEFLKKFHNSKGDKDADEQFADEKNILLKTLEDMDERLLAEAGSAPIAAAPVAGAVSSAVADNEDAAEGVAVSS